MGECFWEDRLLLSGIGQKLEKDVVINFTGLIFLHTKIIIIDQLERDRDDKTLLAVAIVKKTLLI